MSTLRLLIILITCIIPFKSFAQSTITEIVGINSTWKRPISTPAEFLQLLQEVKMPTGDGINFASIFAGTFSPKQYLHFFLLARAAELGWFYPLIPKYGEKIPYGATPSDCSAGELSLQSNGVAAFHRPTWCEHYQWKAAKWIFDILNTPRDNDGDWVIKKLYLLQVTGGEDLSPLEVLNAITGQYPGLQPQKFTRIDAAPYNSQLDTSKKQVIYEAWNSWSNTPEASLRAADLLFFYKQTLSRSMAYGPFGDMRDTSTSSDTWVSKKSQYFLGNELQLSGSFGLNYDAPQLPERSGHATTFAYAGPFIAVNSLTLDNQLSGQKWGLLDIVDFYQPPVLTIKETGSVGGMVIATRSLAIGATILDRPERIWVQIGEKIYPSMGQCGLDKRVIDYSLKQIDAQSNPFVEGLYTAINTDSCLADTLAIWKKVLKTELDARPNALLHRFIKINLNDIRLAPYVVTNFEEAVPFFGQDALQRWNVAIAKRLLTQVQLAELSGQRDELGTLLRDAEALRGRFFITPSNEAATELLPIFGQLRTTMNTLVGKRLLLRGSTFPEIPELSSSMLLGAGSSSETWLIPRSLRLHPTTPSATEPKFGRLWADTANPALGFVRLQFLAELYAPPNEQDAALRLAKARNWKYSGIAPDLQYQSIRQTSAADWIIEDQVRTESNKFLFTIRSKQTFLPVLLAQLARPPGLPLTFDWISTTDSDINSNSAGPLMTTVGLYSIPWSGAESTLNAITNPSKFPLRVVAVSSGSGKLPLIPPLDIDPGQAVPMPGYVKTLLEQNGIVSSESLIDPAGSVDIKQKLELVSNNWSVVPIQVENLVGSYNGTAIKEARILLFVLGSDSVIIYGPLEVSLAAAGLSDSRTELKLFLPAGFKLSYQTKFIGKDGSLIPGPNGIEEGLKISIE